MVQRESRSSTIGHITLGMKQTGAPSAGNPHAGCDVAGAGNGFTVWLLRHSQRKRGETDRSDLRNTAPVLDPTPRQRQSPPMIGDSTIPVVMLGGVSILRLFNRKERYDSPVPSEVGGRRADVGKRRVARNRTSEKSINELRLDQSRGEMFNINYCHSLCGWSVFPQICRMVPVFCANRLNKLTHRICVNSFRMGVGGAFFSKFWTFFPPTYRRRPPCQRSLGARSPMLSRLGWDQRGYRAARLQGR